MTTNSTHSPAAGTRTDSKLAALGPVGPARSLLVRARLLWLRHGWLRTAAALGWLWLGTLILLGRAILFGDIYYESDTLNYYLPVRAVYDRALAQGDLPLWVPEIYGGFPLFADGEGGMLYPVNVVVTLLLDPYRAHLWQLIIRFWLVSAFTFWFARLLGLGRLASLVAGLVFTFGSFTVGQMHHTNVGNSAAWLPALLAGCELAIRARGWRRAGWTALGGLALANALLGIHVQPVLMTLLALGLWTLFRAAPIFRAVVVALIARFRRLPDADGAATVARAALANGLGALLVPAGMLVVALGLAAAQLVPLYELSRYSFRGEGVSYQYATTYGPTPANLVGLIFPAFFQGVGNQWWSLWSKWESTIYVGIAPLALALVATAFRRSRETWFFAALAVGSLLVALADYSPLKLHWLIWQLPGFSVTRAPGRFSFLFTFAAALLAGYGMQWLVSHVRAPAELPAAAAADPRVRWRAHLRDPHVRLRLLGLGVAAAALLIVAIFAAARWWVQAERGRAVALIRDTYLTLQRDPRFRVTPETIVASLEHALDVANPQTALAVALILACAACFLGWGWLRRHPRLWQTLLVLLITVDLLTFALAFHPVMALADVQRLEGPARYLADHHAELGRHYHRGSPPPSTEPNKLMALGLADGGGYSSLELQPVSEFLQRLQHHDGALLDLFDVEYLVTRKEELPLPEYMGVRYDVGRPLSLGVSANPNSKLALAADGATASELRLVLYLRDARATPQDAVIGEVRVRYVDGATQRYPLRAGVEVADESAELARTPALAHRATQPAFYRPILGAESPERLLGYYAAFPLDPARAVEEVAVDFTGDQGQLQVVGAALAPPAGGNAQAQPAQLTRRAKYLPVFEDATGYVYLNRQAMPRAFLAYAALEAPRGAATLDLMEAGAFDPRRQVVLNVPPPGDLPGSPPAALPESSRVQIDRYEDRRVQLSATTGAPAILVLTDVVYPGWRARVDGRDAPLLTADHIFRAVYLPPGEHTVEFEYEPTAFRLGAAISLATLALLLGFGALYLARGRARA